MNAHDRIRGDIRRQEMAKSGSVNPTPAIALVRIGVQVQSRTAGAEPGFL
ncbi:hypothetical protein [Actinomyces ruminis]|nr:hypothetical protein [Actinomyces ruminis]